MNMLLWGLFGNVNKLVSLEVLMGSESSGLGESGWNFPLTYYDFSRLGDIMSTLYIRSEYVSTLLDCCRVDEDTTFDVRDNEGVPLVFPYEKVRS